MEEILHVAAVLKFEGWKRMLHPMICDQCLSLHWKGDVNTLSRFASGPGKAFVGKRKGEVVQTVDLKLRATF